MSELLYDENTWTPAVSSGAGTLLTFTTASGTYTKIGRSGVDGISFTGLAGTLLYDENTWTPAVSSGAGTLPTFTTASGTYTKIGRLVFFNVFLNNTAAGTAGAGANQLSISLPFSTSAAQLAVTVQAGAALNGANEEIIFIKLAASSSTALLYRQTEVANEPELVAFNNVDLNDTNTRQLTLMCKLLV